MTRYLVDYLLHWVGTNGDHRSESSNSNPIELPTADDHDTAGIAVAEEARKKFRQDYGDGCELNITVTRIAEIKDSG